MYAWSGENLDGKNDKKNAQRIVMRIFYDQILMGWENFLVLQQIKWLNNNIWYAYYTSETRVHWFGNKIASTFWLSKLKSKLFALSCIYGKIFI